MVRASLSWIKIATVVGIFKLEKLDAHFQTLRWDQPNNALSQNNNTLMRIYIWKQWLINCRNARLFFGKLRLCTICELGRLDSDASIISLHICLFSLLLSIYISLFARLLCRSSYIYALSLSLARCISLRRLYNCFHGYFSTITATPISFTLYTFFKRLSPLFSL